VSRDPGHWAVGHRCLYHTQGRAANTHLTTAMIAEKLADEIRREAKAGLVEHSRPGANVCIWQIVLQKSVEGLRGSWFRLASSIGDGSWWWWVGGYPPTRATSIALPRKSAPHGP